MAAAKNYSGTITTGFTLDGSEGVIALSMSYVTGTITWTGTGTLGGTSSTAITLNASNPTINIVSSQPGYGIAGTLSITGGSAIVLATS